MAALPPLSCPSEESLVIPSKIQPSTVQSLNSILYGGTCLGWNYMLVSDTEIATFEKLGAAKNELPPQTARIALIEVDSDITATDILNVIAVREDGADPNNKIFPLASPIVLGMVYGKRSFFQIKGINNINNAKILGLEAGKTHLLRISFYG